LVFLAWRFSVNLGGLEEADTQVFGQDAAMFTVYSPAIEAAMRRVFQSLNERDRRLFAAAEVTKLGHGGLLYLSRLFDCDPKTIRRGIGELPLESSLPPGRSRKKGAAEKPV
jgi:hypothetical protein